MTDQSVVVSSILPVVAFAAPLAAGALVFLTGRLGPRVAQALTVLGSLSVALAGTGMAFSVARGEILVSWGEELRVDGLSALLVAVVGVIGVIASIYSLRYVTRPEVLTRLGAKAPGRVSVFYGLLEWFIATMAWGCVTNNIVMLWVAVEATTLTSGLLVAFFWDRKALEAGYKYLMLLTIGITFALFGCVLVYAAASATGALTGRQALLISEVRHVAGQFPAGTALIAVAFLFIGFGTKAGIAPFHPWLPDAHAEAPTPISVLLSGVMIKMAVYALARTVCIFFPTWPLLSVFAVSLGVFTMILGIVMALVQDDLKRLLAYSSVSQMGYVLAGIGLGTYLGCFGGLFHLLNHALYKSLLFMCVGAVIYATGVRKISQLGGLARKMPVTSACFIVGALAISGMPPLNGFMSKLTIFLALARSGLWWAAALAVVTGLLTMVVLVRTARDVFWAAPACDPATAMDVRAVPATMTVPMILLAAACVALGILPQAVFPVLDKAAAVLATFGR